MVNIHEELTRLQQLPRQRERKLVVLNNSSEVALRVPSFRANQLGLTKEPVLFTKPAEQGISRVALAEENIIAQMRRVCTVRSSRSTPAVTIYIAEGRISAAVTLKITLTNGRVITSSTAHGTPAIQEKGGSIEFILLPFQDADQNPTPILDVNDLKTFSMTEALMLKSGQDAGVETAWEADENKFLYHLSRGLIFEPKDYAYQASRKPFGYRPLLEAEVIEQGWADFVAQAAGKFDDEFRPIPKEVRYYGDGAFGYMAQTHVRKKEEEIFAELKANAAKVEITGKPGEFEYYFVRVAGGGLTNFEVDLPAKMPSSEQRKKLPFRCGFKTEEAWPLILRILDRNLLSKEVDRLSSMSLAELRRAQEAERPVEVGTGALVVEGAVAKSSPAVSKALAQILSDIDAKGQTWTGLKHVKVDPSGVRGQALHTFARFHGKKQVAELYVIENAGHGAIYTIPEFGDAFALFKGKVKRRVMQRRPGVRVFNHVGSYRADLLNFLYLYGVKTEAPAKKKSERKK